MAKAGANESLETVSRLLDLVPFLSAHQGISLEELAKEFSVTEIQITQDLNTLWMCGLPGYTPYELIDLSFDTGYVTISNAETLQHPRSLNRDEVLALLLGLESLNEESHSADTETKSVISGLIAKLRELVESRVANKVRSGDSFSGIVLAQVENAIKERESINLKYHSVARDEITTRLVTPLEIVEQDGVPYLHAYCQTSGGYRTFRADRILEVSAVAPIVQTVHPILEAETASNFHVKIHISARRRDAAERLNLKESTLKDLDTVVDFQCFSHEWAVREIMSFGGVLTVQSPEPLRSAIRERSRRTIDGYSKEI